MNDELEGWNQVEGTPSRPARGLTLWDVPAAPGIYFWVRDGEVVYVGKAAGLRRRIGAHLRASGNLTGSALRRNVAHLLWEIPPSQTAGALGTRLSDERGGEIREWLLGCSIGWMEFDTVEAARAFERDLLATRKPRLNRGS